jgi:hypothetical protein
MIATASESQSDSALSVMDDCATSEYAMNQARLRLQARLQEMVDARALPESQRGLPATEVSSTGSDSRLLLEDLAARTRDTVTVRFFPDTEAGMESAIFALRVLAWVYQEKNVASERIAQLYILRTTRGGYEGPDPFGPECLPLGPEGRMVASGLELTQAVRDSGQVVHTVDEFDCSEEAVKQHHASTAAIFVHAQKITFQRPMNDPDRNGRAPETESDFDFDFDVHVNVA